MLPANERRRASQAVRLALACIEQALQASPFPVETLRSVFATDEGTGEVCQQMLEALATTRQVSPLLFPNSVHNAPSGYFSIAWRNRQPATVVSLGLESFASGLLCAVTEAHGHRPAGAARRLRPGHDRAAGRTAAGRRKPTATRVDHQRRRRAPRRAPSLGSFTLELRAGRRRAPIAAARLAARRTGPRTAARARLRRSACWKPTPRHASAS